MIDFGDITSGDPATDLSIAWMLLPAEQHGTFLDAYTTGGGPADEGVWTRARGWALALALMHLTFSADNSLLAGIGQRTIAAVLG